VLREADYRFAVAYGAACTGAFAVFIVLLSQGRGIALRVSNL
jgi:hypothetical protein